MVNLPDEAIDPRLHDLREANAQLVIAALTAQELQAKAEQAQTQQGKFMALVAHELRNPLTPIRTVSMLLSQAGLDKSQLLHLQGIIERQLGHISRLIDDLLDGTRVSAGKFQLRRQPTELAEVLDAAVQMCKPAMDGRHQCLVAKLPPGPVRVEGDPVRLTQIFSNLLENASKYTPHGGQVQVHMEQQGAMVMIAVADQGIGISAAALPHIFDLFVQDTTALAFAPGSQGLGIGLAVVRELVEAHGGSVVATSPGRNLGSEFVVLLPGCANDSPQISA